MNVSFQLDNRPDSLHFHKGTKVLVRTPIFNSGFFVVSRFTEGTKTTTLSMASPDTAQPRGMTVTWLGDSILEDIRIEYVWGMHRDVATDGRCTLLN